MWTYTNTSSSGFCIPIANARYAIGFFIEKYNVGDLAQLGTFLADVFLDVEDSGGIFLQRPAISRMLESNGDADSKLSDTYLQFGQREHMFQNHDFVPSRTGVR